MIKVQESLKGLSHKIYLKIYLTKNEETGGF
jgi:hypothetical protein